MRVRGGPRFWLAVCAVIAVGAAALATIGSPDPIKTFSLRDIDAYPARTIVDSCASPLVDKPGVADFRAMILSQVGGGDDGLAVCKKIANDTDTFSDHADGRAWDWHVLASRPDDRALVDRVLEWLLRTDDRGHRNAMARRLGITYIIWDHRIYRVRDDDSHWRPYTSTSDPHDTHVHFSFSVAGAARNTSWWTERGPLVFMRAAQPDVPLASGSGALRPIAGDWDGDGRDTVGVYNAADRRFMIRGEAGSGRPYTLTPPIGPFGAIPLAGDWDGRAGDEVGVYDPPTRSFSFFSADGAPARASLVFGAAGDLPLVGDWDGDGVDEVGTFTPATQTFSLSLPGDAVRTEVFGSARDTPVVGDWNGDGTDDVGVFRASSQTFLLAAGSADGGGAARPVDFGTGRHLPVAGDWDGDGTDSEGIVSAG